jgi:phosphotransferase system, enzyme I, PtsP
VIVNVDKTEGNPRNLLKKMRDIMAAAGSVDQRLNIIVQLIAAEMVAEVCSLYLIKQSKILELYATEGLNPSAVRKTRLLVGEGLVGHIARSALPLTVSDAQHHSLFAYRPETGEDLYHSLMGAPIIRDGHVIGVLVVQNKSRRHFTDEEVEALETIAMVFAELVAGGRLVNLTPPESIYLPMRIEGTKLISGLAIGHAVLHQPRITITQMVADNPFYETERLDQALQEMRVILDSHLARYDVKNEVQDVLSIYSHFFDDSRWIDRIKEAIKGGLTAEGAVQKIRNDMQARFKQIPDPQFREKLYEYEDISNRLVQHLSGHPLLGKRDLPPDTILIANSMGSAELLDYDRECLRGLILQEGSPTSHIVIVARSLELPLISRVHGILNTVEANDQIILDADNGQVFLRPFEDTLDVFQVAVDRRQRQKKHYLAMRKAPAITKDGTKISLAVNAGFLADLYDLKDCGADGIGLYRTEMPFMVRSHFPSVDEQIKIYSSAIEQSRGLSIVFRTLDIGGDKILPYMDENHEESNPSMGWRSLRISLDRPAIFRQQLRALLIAAKDIELKLMFPMVTSVAEFDKAYSILQNEIQQLKNKKIAITKSIKIGTMLEVPSLIWQLPTLLKRLDFISIGTNDLFQFLYASDRDSPRLGDRYDLLSPGFLNCLKHINKTCSKHKVDVSICGEASGDPLVALALIGLGFQSLSMNASSLGPVKAMIRSLNYMEIKKYLENLLTSPDSSIREKLRFFAHDHDIVIQD